MPWGVAAAAVGVVGSVAAGAMSSSAASSAAQTQADAANRSADLVHQQYLQTAANLAPFLNTGQAAFNRLGTIFGLNSGGGGASSPAMAPAPQANPLSGATSLVNQLGAANSALSGTPFTPQTTSDVSSGVANPLASGTPTSSLPPGYSIQLLDPNAGGNGEGPGLPSFQAVLDAQGNVVQQFPANYTPEMITNIMGGSQQSGPSQASPAPVAPTADPNASADALSAYGLSGLTYNPAQYGLGNGVFDPSKYGLGNGTYDPSQYGLGTGVYDPNVYGLGTGVYDPSKYGLGNGTFDPSQYGLGNGTFQPTQAQLEATPGYQFNLSQGLKSVQNSATARGQGVSGAAMKGAAQYATGLADKTLQTQAGIFNTNLANAKGIYGGNLANTQTIYNANLGNTQGIYSGNVARTSGIFNSNLANAKGIYTGNLSNTQGIFQQNLGNVINPLMSYAQLGENAGAQTGTAGSNAVNAQASLLVGGANAQAAGQVGSANALSSALGSVGQAPMNYALYNQLLGGGGGSQPYGSSPTAGSNPLNYMTPQPYQDPTAYAGTGLGAVY